jgi:hypothetical protein
MLDLQGTTGACEDAQVHVNHAGGLRCAGKRQHMIDLRAARRWRPELARMHKSRLTMREACDAPKNGRAC